MRYKLKLELQIECRTGFSLEKHRNPPAGGVDYNLAFCFETLIIYCSKKKIDFQGKKATDRLLRPEPRLFRPASDGFRLAFSIRLCRRT